MDGLRMNFRQRKIIFFLFTFEKFEKLQFSLLFNVNKSILMKTKITITMAFEI